MKTLYWLVKREFWEHRGSFVWAPIITGGVVLLLTLMSIITEYYTAMGKRPVRSIIQKSLTGHATNIIGGLAIGMESTLLPIIVLAAGIYFSYWCAGLYGVAIAAAGGVLVTNVNERSS